MLHSPLVQQLHQKKTQKAVLDVTQPIQPPEPPFYRFFHDIKVVATAKRTSRGVPLPSMSSSSSLKHSSFTVFKHCQVLCTVYFLIFSGLNSHGAHATFHAPDDNASALPVIVSSSELGFHMRNDSMLAFLWPCALCRHLRKFRPSCTSFVVPCGDCARGFDSVRGICCDF